MFVLNDGDATTRRLLRATIHNEQNWEHRCARFEAAAQHKTRAAITRVDFGGIRFLVMPYTFPMEEGTRFKGALRIEGAIGI